MGKHPKIDTGTYVFMAFAAAAVSAWAIRAITSKRKEHVALSLDELPRESLSLGALSAIVK